MRWVCRLKAPWADEGSLAKCEANIRQPPKISARILCLPTGISTAATNGELRLAFFLAEHHLPLTVADHLVQVVKCVC